MRIIMAVPARDIETKYDEWVSEISKISKDQRCPFLTKMKKRKKEEKRTTPKQNFRSYKRIKSIKKTVVSTFFSSFPITSWRVVGKSTGRVEENS